MADLTPKQIAALEACDNSPTGAAACPARTAFALITMGLAERQGRGAGRGMTTIHLTDAGRNVLRERRSAA